MKQILLTSILFFIGGFSLLQAQTYQQVESVEYDSIYNRFFVSNGNNIIARSSDGTLSFFGSGSANYGMEVMGNTLFAIKNSTINGYDLATEAEVMTITISGATFLNGLTNDGNGILYATDFGSNKIYKIDVTDLANPTFETYVNDTGSTPNGIVYDGANNRLVFASWGANAPIKAVSLENAMVTTLTTTPYSNIDGIDEDNEGNYYISYWSAGTKISKYDADFTNAPITIDVNGLSNPADICYAKPIDTLAIPHSVNQVTFLDFQPIVIINNQDLEKDVFQLSVFPNPIESQSTISFYLEEVTALRLQIFNAKGQLITTLLDGKQVNGTHHVIFDKGDLAAGLYFCELKTEKNIQTTSIIVK